MPRELWKLILDGWYEVSSLGRVRRRKRGSGTHKGKILSPALNGYTGRLQLSLSINGRRFTVYVQKLVIEAFHGPCPKGKEPNHKNLTKTDNRACNLEYLTHQENCQHAWDNGAMSEEHINRAAKRRSRTRRRLIAEGILTFPPLSESVKRKISVSVKRTKAKQRLEGTLLKPVWSAFSRNKLSKSVRKLRAKERREGTLKQLHTIKRYR